MTSQDQVVPVEEDLAPVRLVLLGDATAAPVCTDDECYLPSNRLASPGGRVSEDA